MRMAETAVSGLSIDTSPIEMGFPPISAEHVCDFATATHSEFFEGTPPTFPTVFRAAEFRWLDRLKLEMRHLLHTDQQYQYVRPLRKGDAPTISTRLTEYRKRRGMLFVTLESEIRCDGELAVLARSAFVVRQEEPPEAP